MHRHPIALVLMALLLSVPARAEETILLQSQWPVGTRYVFQDQQAMTQTVSMPMLEEPVKQEMEQTQVYSYSVNRATDDGGREIEMEILSVKMHMQGAGRELAFDSEAETGAGEENPATASFRHFVGAKFVLTLDADGNVTRATGFQELMQKVVAESGGDPAMVAQFANERAFAKMFGHTFKDSFPIHEVKVGDTWPHKVGFPMGPSTINLDLLYTFSGWTERDGHRCAELDFDGTMSGDISGEGSMAGMDISLSDGVVKGRKLFDSELALTAFSETQTDTTMDLTLTTPDGPQKSHTIMSQKQTLSLLRVEKLPAAPAEVTEPEAAEAAAP